MEFQEEQNPHSNTTLVKVKYMQNLKALWIDTIQIQHLLKLNKNCLAIFLLSNIIQIQHLLKLNSVSCLFITMWKCNSNTTLVKVKF